MNKNMEKRLCSATAHTPSAAIWSHGMGCGKDTIWVESILLLLGILPF